MQHARTAPRQLPLDGTAEPSFCRYALVSSGRSIEYIAYLPESRAVGGTKFHPVRPYMH